MALTEVQAGAVATDWATATAADALNTPEGQAAAARLRHHIEGMVGKIVQQGTYAILTMAGPFGELVEVPLDALVDVNKMMELAKPALTLAGVAENTPRVQMLLHVLPIALPLIEAAEAKGPMTPQMQKEIADKITQRMLAAENNAKARAVPQVPQAPQRVAPRRATRRGYRGGGGVTRGRRRGPRRAGKRPLRWLRPRGGPRAT